MPRHSGKSLYLGLRKPSNPLYFHLPMIEIVPFPFDSEVGLQAKERLLSFTHLILTSQTTAELLHRWKKEHDLIFPPWKVIALGKKTGKAWGEKEVAICDEETAEGVIKNLKKQSFSSPFFLYPHSELSRPVIENFLKADNLTYFNWPLYTTRAIRYSSLPDLESFSEIIFTSPSTVDAFLENYSSLPTAIPLKGIGPITENYLTIRKERVSLL